MAQSGPPPPIRMGMHYSSIGASSGQSAGRRHGGEAGHMPSEGRGGGGAGTNPITKALGAQAGDAAGFIPTQDVPIRGLGTAALNLALHPTMVQRAEEEQSRLKSYKESEAQEKQGKVQSAVNSYNQAMQEGSSRGENPNQTLARWMGSPGGIEALGNNTWGAIGAIHQTALQGGPSGPPSVVQLPQGLTGVQMGDGSWHVLTPKQMETSQAGKGPVMGPLPGGGKGPGYFSFDPDTGRHVFTPALTRNAQGQAVEQTSPPAKNTVTPQAQLSEAEALRTVLESGQKMLNNLGATGSLGWGSGQRMLAIKTPLSGAQGEVYAQAYSQMEPALVQLNRVQGQSKVVAQLAMDQLPKPGEATAFLLNQRLPSIMLAARERVGDLNKGAKVANKGELIARTEDTVRTFDANPAKMADLRTALQGLATNPSALSPEQVKLLSREAANGRLPYDAVMGTARQMGQIGLMDKGQMEKAAAADPNFGLALTPREIRPDRIPPPDHLAQPGVMATPPPLGAGGSAAGPALPGQGPSAPGVSAPTPGVNPNVHPPIATPEVGPGAGIAPQIQAPATAGSPLAGPNAPPPMTAPQAVQQSGMPKPQLNTREQLQQQIPQQPQGGVPLAAPMAPQRQGLLEQLNPISSAMASEAPQQQLTEEEKQLQTDIAQAAKIAPDPGTPDLIEATRRAIASPETAVEPASGQ